MSYLILTISGSLRAGSVNGEVLHALSQIAPDDMEVTAFEGLSMLPPFNPDHDIDPPRSVMEWRDQLQRAHAVIICSPEYAHGIPGALKNALDWVVGSGELMHKPVTLINASPGSSFVIPQLTETLTVMMANVSSTTLLTIGKKRDALSMRLDVTIASELQTLLSRLRDTVNRVRASIV